MGVVPNEVVVRHALRAGLQGLTIVGYDPSTRRVQIYTQYDDMAKALLLLERAKLTAIGADLAW